jgi:hypothetical protein
MRKWEKDEVGKLTILSTNEECAGLDILPNDVEMSINPVVDNEEDDLCDVCMNGDNEEGNDIVFCSGCNLCVHQACYGDFPIPDDDWYCDRCLFEKHNPSATVSCEFCHKKTGMFKLNADQVTWCHVVCAIWIPELGFESSGPDALVMGQNDIDPHRFTLLCSLCRKRGGACIQCSHSSPTPCRTAFHPLCARYAGASYNKENYIIAFVQLLIM